MKFHPPLSSENTSGPKMETGRSTNGRRMEIEIDGLDKLTGKIRYQRDHKFIEDWGRFTDYLKGTNIPKEQKRLFMYGTTAARMLLAQSCKEDKVPTREEWQTKLMDYAEMAKLTGKLRR